MCGWIQLEVNKIDGYGESISGRYRKGLSQENSKDKDFFFLRNKMEKSQDGRRHPGKFCQAKEELWELMTGKPHAEIIGTLKRVRNVWKCIHREGS